MWQLKKQPQKSDLFHDVGPRMELRSPDLAAGTPHPLSNLTSPRTQPYLKKKKNPIGEKMNKEKPKWPQNTSKSLLLPIKQENAK